MELSRFTVVAVVATTAFGIAALWYLLSPKPNKMEKSEKNLPNLPKIKKIKKIPSITKKNYICKPNLYILVNWI
jgi:hypothetical protein